MHHAKRFLEKIIGQENPATVGFWRFDWEGASGIVEFCDCPLSNSKIG
jgi:hypothetical protein